MAVQTRAEASERTLPMRFELRQQAPAGSCAGQCQTWISATGAITADTPRDFDNFAQGRNLHGVVMALDSDGGSVLGAISLGREIRRLDLTTTVGRVVDTAGAGATVTKLMPNAYCESMCVFVLLGGAHRIVPPEARVMVHQIWLGDRRDDPTAANYSAEDLVLVQRDIGRLAQYTEDMGASIGLLDLSLRIPPWEPMHTLTRDELVRVRLDSQPALADHVASASATMPAPPRPVLISAPPATNGLRTSPISERGWAMLDRSGSAVLARQHPLTLEGENIGSFDLVVSCAADGNGNDYHVGYTERRRDGDEPPAVTVLSAVSLVIGGKSVPLKILSSERNAASLELKTVAGGTVPAKAIDMFATGKHSMTIDTETADTATTIRIGNSGAPQNVPLLAASCAKAIGNRADLSLPKTASAAQE
ncbi:MAG TPA: hypothetical protein VHV58_02705 [Pseudolabrys sp.]|nr:hypothetical protein [Pseudolabrys sp.]